MQATSSGRRLRAGSTSGKVGEQALSEARRRADRKQSLPSPRPRFDHVLAFGSAYRPLDGLLHAIEQGAKALARFEKQFGPALERSRQMQKMAQAVERAAPLLKRSRSLEMLKAIPQMPMAPSSRQLEMLKQAMESPAMKAMEALLNKKTGRS